MKMNVEIYAKFKQVRIESVHGCGIVFDYDEIEFDEHGTVKIKMQYNKLTTE